MVSAVSPTIQIALFITAIAGGLTDLRTRKIPNWLNLSGVILGIGLNTLFLQDQGLKLAVEGIALAFVIYVPLYLIRAMGAGDVKFMAAIGAFIGPENWLGVFLTTAILGGVASVGLVVARNRLELTLANLSTIASELIHGRLPFHKDPSLDVHDRRAVGLPHGSIIAISVCLFLLFLYRQK
jgi:prepilin peptidase CpaA